MKRKKVGLFFGGTSDEREVSLISAKNVAQYLNKKKYDVTPIEIAEDGRWLLNSSSAKQVAAQANFPVAGQTKELVTDSESPKIDVALIVVHGPGGEDGTVQALLEIMKIPYTGSGVLGSALGIDKAKTKSIVSSWGVPVLPGVVLNKKDKSYARLKKISAHFKSFVTKPNRVGSSLGVTIVKDKKVLKPALKKAFDFDDQVMVEPYVEGRELTVPVLGNEKPKALPVIEIIPWSKSKFYDYSAKYAQGGSEHVIPAKIPPKTEKLVKKYALSAHLALGCRGVTRSDFILDKKGNLHFLEINTIPGMTATSLVPQSAQKAGISFSKLLDELIRLARLD